MEKISKAHYDYVDVEDGCNQYSDVDFENTLIVDAKYVHAMIPSDRGNRYIEALPPPRTDQEIVRDYSQPILAYNEQEERMWPTSVAAFTIAFSQGIGAVIPDCLGGIISQSLYNCG